jgi:hypothetical protein
MANKTKCLTPGTHFTTKITGNTISIEARLPFDPYINEEEAETLETLLHNQMELVLHKYFLLHITEEEQDREQLRNLKAGDFER